MKKQSYRNKVTKSRGRKRRIRRLMCWVIWIVSATFIYLHCSQGYTNKVNTTIEFYDNDCVHTGKWVTEEGDTFPWTRNGELGNCHICGQ